MFEGGFNNVGGREAAPNLWPEQARGEEREQDPKVLRLHVESSLMGHGMCCNNGHCFGKWRGNSNNKEEETNFISIFYFNLIH